MSERTRCIAFVSPLGGTGQTTLVANLATLLAQRNISCLAVDLCTQNGLGLHLGFDSPPDEGWVKSAMAEQWWAGNALLNSLGVTYLPFGNVSNPALSSLQKSLATDSNWLYEHLHALDLNPNEVILLDAPAWPSLQAQQALRAADLVIVCLDASGRSCKLENSVRLMLKALRSQIPHAIVITSFDPRRQTQCDAVVVLREQWATSLIPYTVHNDESIPEAFAKASCASATTSHAQSVHDMQGIASWLIAQCNINEPDAP